MSDSQNGSESYEREFQYYVALLRDKNAMADAFRAFAAAKNAIDGLRLLAQYGDEIKDAQKYGEFMRIIAETNLQLAETQNRLAEQMRQNSYLRDEIAQLKKEIEELKDEDSKPVFQDGLYYVNNQGPYCTGCYDNQRKLIRVIELPVQAQLTGCKYQCPICNSVYSDRNNPGY
jgi:hypothetical protein